MSMSWKLSTILWIVAVVLFLLSALSINVGTIGLGSLGLAALAAGFVAEAWKM